jgi:hypothetical protein
LTQGKYIRIKLKLKPTRLDAAAVTYREIQIVGADATLAEEISERNV